MTTDQQSKLIFNNNLLKEENKYLREIIVKHNINQFLKDMSISKNNNKPLPIYFI